MSLSQTINYDTPGNFSYDTAKIEVDASNNNKARLKLVDNPGQVFAQGFSSDAGFTYDADKAEFVGGLVRQKDQRGDGVFFASFASSLNANWGAASLTGTGSGGAAASGGKLDLKGTTPKSVSWNAGNIAAASNKGCVRISFTPNYSGTPADTQVLFFRGQSGGGLVNYLDIAHLTTGNLRSACYDSSGALIFEITASFSPTASQSYEIELNWDVAPSGSSRVFLDGNLFGSSSATGTVTTFDAFRIGEVVGLAPNQDFELDFFAVFSLPQHVAAYTAPAAALSETAYVGSTVILPAFSYTGVGTILAVESSSIAESGSPRYIVGGKYWNGSAWVTSNLTYAQANDSATAIANLPALSVVGATSVVVRVVFQDSATQSNVDNLSVTVTGQIYPTDNPSIEPASLIDMDGLDSFTADSGGTGAVRFQLRLSGILYYWSGSAWVVSDGTFAQANTAPDIHANRAHATLVAILSVGKEFRPRALLNSNGQQTAELTSVSVEYNFFAPSPDPLSECIVYGFAENLLGEPYAAPPELLITLEAKLFHGDFVILPGTQSVAADADGRWEIPVIQTETVARAYLFKVRYIDEQGNQKTVELGRAQVPNASTANVSELTFT